MQAACNGSRMSAEPKLPAGFPQIEEDKLVYTQQSTNGPTESSRATSTATCRKPTTST